jgi:TIR domain
MMASLKEYFIKDASHNLCLDQLWPISNSESGYVYGEIQARLHLDFDACAQYASFFIPEMDGVDLPEAVALNSLPELLKKTSETVVQSGIGAERTDGRELVFTGRIYFYSERAVKQEHQERLVKETKAAGYNLIFRSVEYMAERNRFEKPLAFISHDGRDKKGIAEPLALKLMQFMCPVWFDQYSLRVGDSLRGSIEAGLKECPKCVLILTPNFLNNNGWTKVEYDSIFTRELVERKKVILPVWHDVTADDVYKYSPILADRVAAQWSDGVDETARKLFVAIEARSTS